jgi:branched-chain amino acid transport system ATP-binding protein
MVEPILKTANLYKRFGALPVAEDVSLDILPNEIHALIGPNGAGKTSLLRLVAGFLAPDAGEVFFESADITGYPLTARARLGMARTSQPTSIFRDASTLENVILSYEASSGCPFKYFGRVTDAAVDSAMSALHEVGLADQAELKASALTHGEQRRLELAMALVTSPLVLVLDEPLAGTGPDESRAITRLLKSLRLRCAILLIEHDMEAVFSLADRISVMVGGRIIASGPPDIIKANADVQAAYLGREKEAEHA